MTHSTVPQSSNISPKRPIVRTASRLADKPLKWLWPGRIPLGAITIIEGEPGISKSLVTTDLAARVSRGDPMPFEDEGADAADVLLLAAEDDAAQTIKPRLKAAKALTRKVHFLNEIECGEELRPLILPDDIDVLRGVIAQKGVRLLVIDPLSAFASPKYNLNSDQSVRQLLRPLAKMAETLELTVLIIRHLNKSSSVSAMNRGIGSIALAGVARSVMLIAKHPSDDGIRVLAPTKLNLGLMPASLTYRVRQTAQGPQLQWIELVDLTADELLATANKHKGQEGQRQGPEKEKAIVFLEELLKDGPVKAAVVHRQGMQKGLSWKTILRAKEAMGVPSIKNGYGGAGNWSWSLPDELGDEGSAVK